jgi:hypothetical protein
MVRSAASCEPYCIIHTSIHYANIQYILEYVFFLCRRAGIGRSFREYGTEKICITEWYGMATQNQERDHPISHHRQSPSEQTTTSPCADSYYYVD